MYAYTFPNVYDQDFDKYFEEYEDELDRIIAGFRGTEEDKTLTDIMYSIHNVNKPTRERTQSINHLNVAEEIYSN